MKKLRSLLASLHYLSKFIANLAQINVPLRPLLRKSAKFDGTKIDENFFHEIKNRIGNAIKNCHYNSQLQKRVRCDASCAGMGAAVEQLTVDGWKLIAFTSIFLYSYEERYSVSELKLFGVVWSIEYLKTILIEKKLRLLQTTEHFHQYQKETAPTISTKVF